MTWPSMRVEVIVRLKKPKALGRCAPRPEGGRQRSRGRVAADVTISDLAVLP